MTETLGRPAVAVPDRWRIGWPSWDRYGRQAGVDSLLMNTFGGDSPYTEGSIVNPFDRNVLKGDYPVLGDDIFFRGTAISDTFFQRQKLPTPTGPSFNRPGAFGFFGDGTAEFLSQSVFVTAEVFKGNTSFKPVDWLFHVTGAYNFNRLELRERNAVNVDVRKGDVRTDDFATVQEIFFEYHLGDTSPWYDFAAVRAGRQLFLSDFRGFIYNDVGDGVRLLGNAEANRIQYNVALFNQNDKDTNSGLSELDSRDQQVMIANLYVQDFLWKGYTSQWSFHWNHDQSDRAFDDNGFLVIPANIGNTTLSELDAYYLGWAGDGHIGRFNVNHAFYYAFGEHRDNAIVGRDVDIGAYLGALELSYDMDWFRPKVSFLYASGDRDPLDDKAGGFDGIFDNPFFAGGPGSFYQSQALRLFGVDLSSVRSFYNDLTGTKAEGQANFVNPGTMLLNAGFEAEITPKLRSSFNYNRVWFADTSVLELALTQPGIDRHLGDELNVSLQYRPMLNNNVILTVGGSTFFPGDGFEAVFETDETLYQVFTGITLTY